VEQGAGFMNEQEIKEVLLYQYRELYKSQPQIEKEFNIPRHMIRKYLKQFNITYKTEDKEWLENEIRQNKTYTQIEKENNLPRLSVWRSIQKLKLEDLYKEFRPRNRNDLNDIVIHDTYAELFLYNIMGEYVTKTEIDLDVVHIIKEKKWHFVSSTGYVTSKENNSTIYLQDYIFSHDDDFTVDHIDRNKLNNKRSNFRLVTASQNRMNKKLQSNNTSGVSGVSWDKRYSKWRVRVKVKSKEIQIGTYITIEEAVQQRVNAEAKYYGQYSPNYNFSTNQIELLFRDKLYTALVE
jgi:hypothetical protein